MDKVKCFDCGFPYGAPGWIEAVIPDRYWKIISPTQDEGGILCINCISKRLVEHKLNRVPVWLNGTEPLVAMAGDKSKSRLASREAELERLREAVEFYADKKNWEDQGYENGLHWVPVIPAFDDGEKAREALAAIEEKE